MIIEVIIVSVIVLSLLIALLHGPTKFRLIMKPPGFVSKLLFIALTVLVCTVINSPLALVPGFVLLGLIEYYKNLGDIVNEDND